VRELDPDTLSPRYDQDVWTDYVGDVPVLDYVIENYSDIVSVTAYLPGISQTDVAAGATYYLHGDHLGSTWYTSTKPGSEFVLSGNAIRTAFGETVQNQGTPTRYPGHLASRRNVKGRAGYAGAWGYQEHDTAGSSGPGTPDGYPDSLFKTSPTAGFPFMHVGHRYYDPGSGRFVQRDPIGIAGGLNVYGYGWGSPLRHLDPSGLAPCPHCGHDPNVNPIGDDVIGAIGVTGWVLGLLGFSSSVTLPVGMVCSFYYVGKRDAQAQARKYEKYPEERDGPFEWPWYKGGWDPL
jgi:RHS repeat-associated protein